MTREIVTLPVVPLHDTVILPGMVLPLRIGRRGSVRAIQRAQESGGKVLLIAEKETGEDVAPERLHRVGTLGQIVQLIRLPDGTFQAVVQGNSRVTIDEAHLDDGVIVATVAIVPEPLERTIEVEALVRGILDQLARYAELSRDFPEGAVEGARQIESPARLADAIGYIPDMTFARRQELLEIFDPIERLRWVTRYLSTQLEILETRDRIQGEVRKAAEGNQHEFILREQLKAIQKELGERGGQEVIADDLRAQVEAAGMPGETRARALREVGRLETLPSASPEVAVIRNYVDWLLAVPWSRKDAEQVDLVEAERTLNEDHHGLEKVKERILEFIAVRKLVTSKADEAARPRPRSPILLLVGPPGVGKTSLGRSLARALGRKYARLSLGGVHDEAEIRGHRRTYVGAMPGRFIQALKTAGTMNPVFVIDEIDKVGRDFRGDPTAALLEVLDPEQNGTFSDHYLEVPVDLSDVIFVATANQLDTIPSALRDRMETIEIAGYTEAEKRRIARSHLLPKQLEAHGLTIETLRIPDTALLALIRDYTREAGVRSLERELAGLARKAARRLAEGKITRVTVRGRDLDRLIGPTRFEFGMAESRDEVGIATGVAWTPVGGDVLTVEVGVMPGKGDLILTGQLGDVMRESAMAAVSYARSRSRDLGIPDGLFEKSTIHVHVPAGAVPKDGPSAGITIATALVSALTGRPVRRDVAMTGEVTLRGRVLPIGGLKEKMLAAQRAGIGTFILPLRNRKDLREVAPNVLKRMTIVPVAHVDEVLAAALLPAPSPELREVA
ncbi:MAG: endopeptidase La [Chloroflexota bacterium]|nr:MAG: endopeptidase La [Chloroflexota bacterium]